MVGIVLVYRGFGSTEFGQLALYDLFFVFVFGNILLMKNKKENFQNSPIV